MQSVGVGVEYGNSHTWLDFRMVQPLWKTSDCFFKKLSIDVPCDPDIQS